MVAMYKKYLPFLIVGAVLVLGIGGYLFLNANKASVPATVKEEVKEKLSTGKNSIKGLLASKVPQKCTFSDEKSSGTVYVNGGKVRGDFETTTDSKKTLSHIIIDGTVLYGWSDGTTAGYKMTFDPKVMEDAKETAQKSVDVNQEVDYSCMPWVVDGGQFVAPTNVKFQDFSAFMPKASASGSPSGAAMSCATCSALTGDDKTECLQLLKCPQ